MGEGVAEGPLARLMATGPVGSLVRRQGRRYAVLLRRAGRVGSPVALGAASVRSSLCVAAVALPAAALLSALVSPWFLALSALPGLGLALPELKLRDEVAQRREGVERDLPFFSVFAGVLGGAGVSLYSMLKGISGSDVFPGMRTEAQIVKRDVEIFGMNPNESLERLAAGHPSRRFSEFLLGYTSKSRSGGDVPGFLSAESGSLLRDLGEGWARYVARVGIVGSMMITVFGVVPLLLMVVGVFSPGFSIVGLSFYTGVGVPVFTIGLLFMAGRMQPMGDEPVHGKVGKSMLLAVPGVALGVWLGAYWAAVAVALFGFFVAYGATVKGRLAELGAMDRGLSKFLKELLEYKRQDYDLARAVVAIESEKGFDLRFQRVLGRVATQLRAGVPLDEVKTDRGSRLGRLVFLLLGEMSRSGGGTVDTVYQVSNFADRLTEMRRNAVAEMKPYLVLSYVSPLLLAFGITFVGGVLSSFSGRLRPGLPALRVIGIQVGAVPPGLSQVSDLLIVVSAASLGLIGAKITDMTVRNTLRASVNVALAVGAIAAMGALGSHGLMQVFSR